MVYRSSTHGLIIPLFRDGIRNLLQATDDLMCVGEAETGDAVIARQVNCNPQTHFTLIFNKVMITEGLLRNFEQSYHVPL